MHRTLRMGFTTNNSVLASDTRSANAPGLGPRAAVQNRLGGPSKFAKTERRLQGFGKFPQVSVIDGGGVPEAGVSGSHHPDL